MAGESMAKRRSKESMAIISEMASSIMAAWRRRNGGENGESIRQLASAKYRAKANNENNMAA